MEDMVGDLINLRQARKRREQERRRAKAAEHRAASGRTKAERHRDAEDKARSERRLDLHRRDDRNDDDP